MTRFVRTPSKVIRTARASARVVLRFAADQPDATFLCKIDGAAYRPCAARIVRRFRLGSHVVRVRAVGASGLLDPTPLVFRFRVKRI